MIKLITSYLFLLCLVLGGDFFLFSFVLDTYHSLAFASLTGYSFAVVCFSLVYNKLPRSYQIIDWLSLRWHQTSFWGFLCLSLLLRANVLCFFLNVLHWSLFCSASLSLLLAFSFLCWGEFSWSLAQKAGNNQIEQWRFPGFCCFAYLLCLRLVYIGTAELMPQEAYYWNYAQHLAWSYLDHPPMVAWIIRITTGFFGQTAFAVHLGALLASFVTMGFVYGFTKRFFGKQVGLGAVLLLGFLPFFFGTSIIMTPDAPLIACWSGSLFFLQRVFFYQQKRAWVGVGLMLGLGMLSKYTICLLGPAILLFMLLDKQSRFWFKRKEPYLAVLLASIIFLPVLVWNAQHQWISFVFQGSRRVQEHMFTLHYLVFYHFMNLTPTGVAAIMVLFSSFRVGFFKRLQSYESQLVRKELFMYLFTLIPLSVFIIFSVSHKVKLNWSGPLWLALIPLLVYMVWNGIGKGKRELWLWGAWQKTALLCMLVYGFLIHYLLLGIPGIPYPDAMKRFVGWQELGSQVTQVLKTVTLRDKDQALPLVVGLGKYNLASELAFYLQMPEDVSSQNVFGKVGVMYEFWFPNDQQVGRTMVVISEKARSLASGRISRYFSRYEPIQTLLVRKNNKVVTHYYYRICYDYHQSNV